MEDGEDGLSGVVAGGLWRGVRGSDPKLNGERRGGSGGNERGNGTSGSRGHRGLGRGVDGVIRHCAMVERLGDDREEMVVIFILLRGCL